MPPWHVMTSTTTDLWSEPVTRRVFGIVPDEAVRRHPSELWRIGAAAVIVAVTAVLSLHVSKVEKAVYAVMSDIPGGLRDGFWVIYLLGTAGVLIGLTVAVLVARRLRFALILIAAGVIALGLGALLQAVVNSEAARTAAGLDDPATPTFPVILLAVSTAVILVASAYLTRTARHLVVALLAVACLAATLLTLGLSSDVIGALALGWGVAAGVRLAVGSPEGTPSVAEVTSALTELGVQARDLELTPEQVWGEVRYTAVEELPNGDAGEPLSIVVIGRDASDARLFSKLWRFLWYKDSGPEVSITRLGQLERRAYLLLLAAQAGIPAEHVVAAGTAGEDEDAVLVLREPTGVRLPALTAGDLTDDVLVDTWSMAERLHGARVVHGTLTAGNVVRQHDGSIALLDFSRASSSRTATRVALDRVELLSTTAALVGEDRALTAAQEVLGRDGLSELLSFLEPAAISAPARKEMGDRKDLLKSLREAGAERAGVDPPTLVPLRRISLTNILMAVGTILGVYLLIAQFSDVPNLGESLRSAQKGWVVVTALLSQLPQFAGAFVMLGSVATQLPYGPTLAVQFANNFTGFVAGSVGTTAMIIRYFQRQGLTIAVAVSSGVLKTLSGMVVEFTLVAIALLVTWGDYNVSFGSDSSSSGSDGGGHTDLILLLIIVAGVAVGAIVTVPKLRKRVHGILAPQVRSARVNLREIASMPGKALQLFGGNLASEVLFALTLQAALHAYGESLPLLQVILINSFASLIGGLAPIPGGMGVVEAGLIAGFTAAGVPQTEAVAATFTARTFTTYLPPIWGWFALRWLRRRNLV
jgi:glycosyltransferase 2 family protein